LTIKADEVTFSGSFSKYASVPCLSIAAKASCILTYDMEESLDLGSVASYTLLNVQYLKTN
ncbi:MAG: hypothetical protein OIF50_07310, partial [Flavobacteriaceae bacterium]|nr:hypothetical protein [Flavobacteriaceae bacterium]MCV6629650.1 hypothetical protein [Flavobacteriaceae bacterium]